ncbi:MAG: hypothetical protein ABIQ11_12095, partial [Saprospiraceae bacterium]
LYGPGLILGTGVVYGQSFVGDSNIITAIDFKDAINEFYVGSDFNGKVIVDVTEDIFFSTYPWSSVNPPKYINYYEEKTPSQHVSFMLNKPLENTFVFVDKDYHSINALLHRLEIKSRPGVFMDPIFPRDFERNNFGRQCYMQTSFVADTSKQRVMSDIWRFFASFETDPAMQGEALDSLLDTFKIAADKIKAKGGHVLFVRTPSSGGYWEREQLKYPRDKYWDKLLTHTECPGIHFKDDPATDHYICPEESHLTPADAIDYTHQFIRILKDAYGWKFRNTRSM